MLNELFKAAGIPVKTRNFLVDYQDKAGRCYHKPMQSIMHDTEETDFEAIKCIMETIKEQNDSVVSSIIEVQGHYSLDELTQQQDNPSILTGSRLLYLNPLIAFQ